MVTMIELWSWCLLAALVVTSDAQQSDGPIILAPNEIKLDKGQNYTIRCKGKRPLQFKQQDVAEEKFGNFTTTTRNVAPSDVEYGFEIALDMYEVDQYAVGYFACFDDQVNASEVLADLFEEPANTEHIAYTYVFVNDSKELLAPMREIVSVVSGSKIVIECKPTYPDIQVSLTVKPEQTGNKRPHILGNSPKIGFLIKVHKSYTYLCEGLRGTQNSSKIATLYLRKALEAESVAKPRIVAKYFHFLEGETISLNCTVTYKSNSAISLEWTIPRGDCSEVDINSNENETLHGMLYRAIYVKNAKKTDAGSYYCTAKTKNNGRPLIAKCTMNFAEKPFLNLTNGNDLVINTTNAEFSFLYTLNAYPPATYRFYKDNNIAITDSSKYIMTKTLTGNPKLVVSALNIYDTGNYTIEAKTRNLTKTLTYTLYVADTPRVQFDLPPDRKLVGTTATLRCDVTGYPVPTVVWSFVDDDTNELKNEKGINKEFVYKVISTLKMAVTRSGTIQCSATNTINGKVTNNFVQRRFLVDEIADGFGIPDCEYVNGRKQKWVYENQFVKIKCLASKYAFSSVTWLGPGPDYAELPDNMVEYYNSSLSYITVLKIERITQSQAGDYMCVGYNATDESEQNETVSITVADLYPPNMKVPVLESETKEVIYGHTVQISCVAEAVPPPKIFWTKNGQAFTNNITVSVLNHTTVNSTYTFKKEDDTTDEYECIAKSGDSSFDHGIDAKKSYIVNIKTGQGKSPYKHAYLSAIGIVFIALIILVVYLIWKVKKEKRFRKELAAAGLLYFKEGATKSLNPDLGIDEQAELLPYDDKFEFPPDKLTLGTQLGAGAFGVVYKAEARGIINAEETTTVAVKMVKKTADNIFIKALASELKIMVHLGKHVNIVNLLGACTKNVGKRELIVIVEFCKFGNIHNYLQRHREVFIDQLTDNKEKHQGNVNRAFSCSSGNSGMNSDCFSSNQTQETDHTFLNTAASNRSGRTVSETGYVQPEWRSNYESDYVSDGRKPRPLYSRDLLAWAFQIARGMEYLASRKILHGDLAARNILLAEDNVVKICDFGLARSIYKNDEYQKKENSPLPVKWLAVECMTDRIFSTQSDVWSFGIVLWELFSLAKTPYPEISPQNLLPRLLDGHRLDKPMYADDRLYQVMRSCWEQRPGKRPTFSDLQETIGTFLEDNVRNHYVELNAPCANQNADRTGEDYLVRVCAPDYNNQITPSPHHYANDVNGFFFGINPSPTTIPLQHDDEGYLAMTPASNPTIFSPRLGPAFDFDPRSLNPRVSAASQGSELTPMLTLNHMSARSGSESDQEGNASPYLNMYPRIDEETDEVFEKEQKNNIKNSQNNAVTNPTYISFPSLDKKSPIIANNYVNINANGLVK